MSMVSSYTLLSRGPPLGKLSRAPVQPSKQHAAAAVALPRVLRKQSRAPLFVCDAANDKHTYNMQPLALVHPKFPPTSDANWTIREDADRINLWFFVGQETKKDQLEVSAKDKVLRIRYKGDSKNDASQLDVRLLIPNGYDEKKVEAELAFGTLLVTVPKPKPGDPTKIEIVEKPTTNN